MRPFPKNRLTTAKHSSARRPASKLNCISSRIADASQRPTSRHLPQPLAAALLKLGTPHLRAGPLPLAHRFGRATGYASVLAGALILGDQRRRRPPHLRTSTECRPYPAAMLSTRCPPWGGGTRAGRPCTRTSVADVVMQRDEGADDCGPARRKGCSGSLAVPEAKSRFSFYGASTHLRCFDPHL